MRKSIFLFLCLSFAFNVTSFAQDSNASDTTKTKKKKLFKKGSKVPEQGKLYLIPLPAVASNPSAGFIYGVAATAGIYFGDPSTTQISSGVMAFTGTTKNQVVFAVKTNIFTPENLWIFNGDLRIFKTSQPTYGLGTGPQSSKITSTGIVVGDEPYTKGIDTAQMLHFNWIRFHEAFLRKIQNHLYVGPGYHLDRYYRIDDKLLDLDTTDGNLPTITSHWGYNSIKGFDQNDYTLSGISMNALWDSRDNTITPYKGIYGLISFKYYPEFLGSDQASSQLWAEYREYFGVSKKQPSHLIALWAYASVTTSGNTPYLGLPSTASDQFGRSGRAYTQGRFRGEEYLYGEIEYRFPLPIIKKNKDLLAGVAFVNGNTASSEGNKIRLFDYIDPAYGIGLRILVNRKTRAHITIDYAWGNYGAGGFYFNINETF